MKNSVSDSSFRFNRNAKSKPKLCAKKRDCSLLSSGSITTKPYFKLGCSFL